jgi:hypothetical protein
VNEDTDKALKLFELTEPFTRDALEKKKQELLLTWHPHRYANLTNNPKKYMKMYTQAEAMTKEIQAAYEVLVARVEKEEEQG